MRILKNVSVPSELIYEESMIKREDVFRIGVLTKPHGVKGELSMQFTDDVFDRVDADYLVLDIDGIMVPFFIEEYRFKNDSTLLITFEDIDTAEKAALYAGVEVYFPHSLVDDVAPEEMSLSYFVGFEAFDTAKRRLGKVSAIDDSTANVLFVIDTDGDELLIPAHDDLIADIDMKGRRLTFSLPEGMV